MKFGSWTYDGFQVIFIQPIHPATHKLETMGGALQFYLFEMFPIFTIFK